MSANAAMSLLSHPAVYPLRVCLAMAALLLLRQERGLPGEPPLPAPAGSGPRHAGGAREIAVRVFLRGVLEYLKPGFHPDQVDDAPLANRFLAGAGLL